MKIASNSSVPVCFSNIPRNNMSIHLLLFPNSIVGRFWELVKGVERQNVECRLHMTKRQKWGFGWNEYFLAEWFSSKRINVSNVIHCIFNRTRCPKWNLETVLKLVVSLFRRFAISTNFFRCFGIRHLGIQRFVIQSWNSFQKFNIGIKIISRIKAASTFCSLDVTPLSTFWHSTFCHPTTLPGLILRGRLDDKTSIDKISDSKTSNAKSFKRQNVKMTKLRMQETNFS